MQERMKNPAQVIPGALTAILDLSKAAQKGGVDPLTLELVHMRASQINGCSGCIAFGLKSAREHGESNDRLIALSAWREMPCFDDAERAALDLTEAATRLADGAGVPDAVWNEAARHYTEEQLASIVLTIGITNLFNRLNVTTRQIPIDF